jgi:hypothetical protein
MEREGLGVKLQSIDRPTKEMDELIEAILHLLPSQ